MRRVRRRVRRYAPRRALVEPDEARLPASVDGVKAGSSVRWSLAAVVGRQVPQLVAALVLARILGPQSYGIVSAASLYVTLTALLLDQGLAAAVVQRPTLHRDVPGAVATVNVLSAVAAGRPHLADRSCCRGLLLRSGPGTSPSGPGPRPAAQGSGHHPPGRSAARAGVHRDRQG